MATDTKRDWPRLVRTAIGVLALVLAVFNVAGAQRNRGLQKEVDATRVELAKSQAFANVNNTLIQLLAKAAAEKNDAALRELLARNGVTFSVKPPPTAPALAAPPAAASPPSQP